MDFKKFEIVPDVLPDDPRDDNGCYGDIQDMDVSYGDVTISAGTKITPLQSEKAPNVSWKANENKFYTLFMTDPDAPSREDPLFREFIHWVVTDIPGNDLKSGVVVMDYLGPAPPHNSGLHRYCFFVYEQKEKGIINVDETKKMFEGRGGKKIIDLVTKSDLGYPIAANIMMSQWGEECDGYHESMGWLPPEKYRSPMQQDKKKEEEKDKKEAKPQRSQESEKVKESEKESEEKESEEKESEEKESEEKESEKAKESETVKQQRAQEPQKSRALFPAVKWADAKSEIFGKILINNAKDIKLEFTSSHITFSARSGTDKYELSLEFYSNVVPAECSWRLKPFFIDLTMTKETKKERWKRLIKSTKKNNKISTDWERLQDWDSDEDENPPKETDDDTDDDTEEEEEEKKIKKKENEKKEEKEESTSWYSPLMYPFTWCYTKCCSKKKKKA